MPQDWQKNIIVSLYKKGDEEKVINYRGISLLSAYNLCKGDRLKREMETKGMLLDK